MKQNLVRDTQLALRSLKTGHILCDLEFNVIMANENASKLLDQSNSSYKTLNLLKQEKISRLTDCINALKSTAQDGLSRTVIGSQVSSGETFQCYISRVGEVLLLQIEAITETQKMIAQARIELSKNSTILQMLNDSILVIDIVEQTLTSNKTCAEVFGDYEELRNLIFDPSFDLSNFDAKLDYQLSEINLEFIEAIRAVWLSDEPKIDLLNRYREDTRYILLRKIIRWNVDDLPRGVIISGTDVSELAKYREEFETSQLQIRELLRNLNIWIAVFDETTGAAELYFPDGNRIQQENFVANLSEPKQALIRDAIAELYQKGFATIVAPTEAGDRIIRTSVSFASDGEPGARKILAINSDVTEKVQYEELENRKEQMAQIQKFAQGIAHDFGNISQSIQGFTKILSEEINSESGRKIVDNLKISATRALNISHKISEISRIQVLENFKFNLLNHLKSNSSQLQDLLGSDIRLEIEHDDELDGDVFANPVQMERIIENIVENASHAINGSGQVKIVCSEDPKSDDFLITISNDGPAIPKQIADRIFMPFVTSRKEGGTGLGLYLAFEYLNSCGGKIELHNQNHDVAFKITLPRERKK